MSRRPNRNNPPARQDQRPQAPQSEIVRQDFWQGPLPPPGALEQFRQLVPDAPERIFDEWQREAAHRRKIEEKALTGNLRTVRFGQVGAITFGLGALGISGLGFWLGYPVEASAVTCTTVVGVVGAFLYQRTRGES